MSEIPNEVNFGSFSLVSRNNDPVFEIFQNHQLGYGTAEALLGEQARLHQFWTSARVIRLASPFPELVVSEFMAYIETRMAEIMQSHSALYWIVLARYDYPTYDAVIRQLYRHLPEKTLRSFVASILGVLEQVARKYGNDHSEFEITGESMPIALVPYKPMSVDSALDSRRLIVLALAFDNAKDCLRGLGHGGHASYSSSFPLLTVHMSDELDRLQSLYEERSRYASPGSWWGRNMDLNYTDALPGEGLSIFAFATTVRPHLPFATHRQDPSRTIGRPNYYRTQLDITGLWKTFSEFPGAFERAMGLSPRDFFGVWVALHRLAFEECKADNRKYQGLQAHGLALLPSHEELIQRLAPHFISVCKDLGVPIPERKASTTLVRALPHMVAPLGTGIELDIQSSAYPLIVGPGRYLLDVTSGAEIFQYIFDAVRHMRGTEGHLKGTLFEDELREVIASDTRLAIWDPLVRNLQFPDGSDGEVDLGIIRGDCLVLVEAKAHSIHPDYLRGTKQGVRDRLNELRKALTQIETTAGKIAEHPNGTNYSLPQSIRTIVTVVCTALPEWVFPANDPNLWLSPRVPRFCTPEELRNLMHRNGPRYFAALPYARQVHKND